MEKDSPITHTVQMEYTTYSLSTAAGNFWLKIVMLLQGLRSQQG